MSGNVIASVNPAAQNENIGRVASASVADANRAVVTASSAFPGWRDTPPERRAALLERAAGLMAERKLELAALIVLEVGKQWREADGDVAEAIDFCRFYAAEMRRLAAPRRRDVPGELNEYFYEPRGVAVVIAPWNFPLAILCGMSAAALVTGNTVIMKPAEQSPVIAARLMDIFLEAGIPAGVINHLPGIGEEIGPALVAHPEVSLIAFTGSRSVGLAINRSAGDVAKDAAEVKRVITEMGGKNAIIVDDDADLDEAVHGVMWSAFSYLGQKCSACSRAIVLPGIYPIFLERLIDAVRSLTIGAPEFSGFALGPLIDGEARERVLGAIGRGKGEARLAYAGEVGDLAERGFFVAPHIFAEVPEASSLAQEEIFGPVLAVMQATDIADALRIANGTHYALTGGCYTRSPSVIDRMRREFRVGNLYINRKITGALVDRQPFGGFKLSGIGSKAGGPDYLLQFVVPRVVTENTLRHGFAPPGSAPGSAEH
jgi:RHH-type transcriptional regulator, proline utilization regulon repressor / proline dehydrogenase / delta 1-pyrroline-5-carboxylate dehydrogenase